MADRIPPVMIENAQIVWRNFEGKVVLYNDKGERNFSVILDEDTAAAMAADGWNVKRTKEREDGEGDDPYIQVTVGYKVRPPRVILVTNEGKTQTQLTEETVQILDILDIDTVDLVINPSYWEVNGKSGIKAYLAKMYFTPQEDDLDRKYSAMQLSEEV